LLDTDLSSRQGGRPTTNKSATALTTTKIWYLAIHIAVKWRDEHRFRMAAILLL